VIRRRATALVPATPRQRAARQRRQSVRASLVGLYAVDGAGLVRQPEITCHPAVLIVRLPHRLESPNAWHSLHWRVHRQMRAAWAARLEHAVTVATPSVLPRPLSAFPTPASRLDWTAPTNHPTVFVTRQVPRRRNFITDRDNRFGACKPVIDAFVKAGFLANDREDDIDLVPEQGVSGDGLDWTIVTIDARAIELRTLPEASA